MQIYKVVMLGPSRAGQEPLPSRVSQSQGSALVTPAEVLLYCPEATQVGEAIMTKEAEALSSTPPIAISVSGAAWSSA